jgi:translation initiation factor IF-2
MDCDRQPVVDISASALKTAIDNAISAFSAVGSPALRRAKEVMMETITSSIALGSTSVNVTVPRLSQGELEALVRWMAEAGLRVKKNAIDQREPPFYEITW